MTDELSHKTAAREDPDQVLVERVQAGDRRAFETLVRRHERRVFRTALAVTDNEYDAEEAMQDTFLKAFLHLGEFRKEALFSTWITRIAVNEGLQKTRRRKSFVSFDDPNATLQPVAPRRVEEWGNDPETRYAALERKRLVEEAIRGLEPVYRVVLVLRDIEQLDAKETAEALDLSVAAVKSRLHRARLMLRESLAPHFELPPSLGRSLRRAGKMMRHMVALGVERMMKPERGR